jgi:transcriptional regulator GlxA family with amidase domain
MLKRLGIYVFKDAEVIDYAGPFGVFSAAKRYDPELDVFLVSNSSHSVQTSAGLMVIPNYSFLDRPNMDAFLIPGGAGTRQEMHNQTLHDYISDLPSQCLLTSVCTGSWIYGAMGLLDGLPATSRKEPDYIESKIGMTPIERLAQIAPAAQINRARVIDAGRMITAGGISSGVELGFHLLKRFGMSEHAIREIARVMEYLPAYELLSQDIYTLSPQLSG